MRLPNVLFVSVHAKRHLLPRLCGERVLDACQTASHKRKEVAGLRERVMPDGKVPAFARHVVTQQCRIFALSNSGRSDRILPANAVGSSQQPTAMQ